MDQADIIRKVNRSGWADYVLGAIHADFDEVTIDIYDDFSNPYVKIVCGGCIGFSWYGIWEESDIDTIKITGPGDVYDRSALEIMQHYRESSNLETGYKSLFGDWHELRITLIDGITFGVAFLTINVITDA